MALVAGSVFAEYTIVQLLGAGGMGKVYLAKHPRLPRHDALKVLRRSLSADKQYRERFRQEAAAAATLFHPNIVGVHDCGEDQGRLWIAMDYIDGSDLRNLMRKRFPAGMPADAAIVILSAVAQALDYAHSQGIVHRDVKPGNILVTNAAERAQRILLADFGVARQLGDPSGLTASNLAIGTVAYAAPEQLIGSENLARADQYALAATAFDLFTGAPPFLDDNPVVVIGKHLDGAPPRLSERRPELARFDDVLITALARDPEDRFGSCSEFVEALSERLDAEDESSVTAGTVVGPGVRLRAGGGPPKPAGRRTARTVVLGSAAATVAAAAGLVLIPRIADRQSNDTVTGATDSREGAVTPDSSAGETSKQSPTVLPAFNGIYRVDANRAGQLYNGVPDPQPPNVSTWWAVRSSCTHAACTAGGVMVDSRSHRTLPTATVGDQLLFDFVDGGWRSRPQTLPTPCAGADGRPGTQTTTQVLSLQPTIHGVFHGELLLTVDTDECGQRGAQIQVPVVATRMGEVADDVDVPDPTDESATAAPPAAGR